MLKKRIFRVISAFCALAAFLSCMTFSHITAENEPLGKMASVFAYTLNDYIYTYGTLRTENAGDALRFGDGTEYPSGVIYSEVVSFDENEPPCLAIFIADKEYTVASCHIWRYDSENEKAERIAILDANYTALAYGEVGAFSMGYNGGERYIIYRTYVNDKPVQSDFYTVIDGNAFKYVEEPPLTSEIGVMDFSGGYFHPGVDISSYNLNLNQFFDSLKNAAADSVTYEDIAERLSEEDEKKIEKVLGTVTGLEDFDIANYQTMDEYRSAVDARPDGDRFYLISEAYSLGEEIYYVRFSTDRSYYNYALLRRSDDAPDGYQILKVRTDCIPLSDRELKQIKTDYDRNTLLYKKAKKPLTLEEKAADSAKPEKKPLIKIEKVFSARTRLPIICVGGGIAVALLTILWVYLYSDSN